MTDSMLNAVLSIHWHQTARHSIRYLAVVLAVTASLVATAGTADAAGLRAGAAKVDITDVEAGPVNDVLYARALVIESAQTRIVLIALDAVAVGEIGYIDNSFLPKVRKQLEAKSDISPTNVFINASHCHGVVCDDVDQRTVQAVQQAIQRLEPVKIGHGTGHEDRIMENRRLRLKNGREIDVRHAYSLPPGEEIAGVGPIDPQIGILRLDRLDGTTLAVVYNFACHPIQGVPSQGNTADITGFASRVIEENTDDGTVALFIQGCGGDINPIRYKSVDAPRDAEPLGNLLALSTLKGHRKIQPNDDDRLSVLSRSVALPRGDVAQRISELESEREQLLNSLGGTSLNLETFIPLLVKYRVNPEFPAEHSSAYLHEESLGRDNLKKLDDRNRQQLKRYIRNIHTMEQLTRVQTNLRLLKKHHASFLAASKRTLDVEVAAIRIGEFVLVTFPGELTVRIGLGIKKRSPHKHTFVAGYTNGYIYYAPTSEQLLNLGRAQEDSDCLLAPEWQDIFDRNVDELLESI